VPGTTLDGRYLIGEVLGEGAQSVVYRAHHRSLGQSVAIKCLRRTQLTEEGLEHFRQEAETLARIRNPHVVAVRDVGVTPFGVPFMVTDYLEGRDLRTALSDGHGLTPDMALSIAMQLCEGLAAVHAVGMIHGDIKPENVFLANIMGVERATLIDFGLTRFGRDNVKNGDDAAPMLGTPLYMAPELLEGQRDAGPGTDVFSLGLVIYEMLRGSKCLLDGAQDLALRVGPGRARLELDWTGFPADLRAAIDVSLSLDPATRYANSGRLAMALCPFVPAALHPHATRAMVLLRAGGVEAPRAVGPQSATPPVPDVAPSAPSVAAPRPTMASFIAMDAIPPIAHKNALPPEPRTSGTLRLGDQGSPQGTGESAPMLSKGGEHESDRDGPTMPVLMRAPTVEVLPDEPVGPSQQGAAGVDGPGPAAPVATSPRTAAAHEADRDGPTMLVRRRDAHTREELLYALLKSLAAVRQRLARLLSTR
jgi:serine/threonine-protein kinase